MRSDYDAISFTEERWDNLVILDGCRFDLFDSELVRLTVPVNKVHSNASHTRDFLKINFSGKNMDMVYVAGTPWIKDYENSFCHVEHVWKEKWSEEKNTVLPADMTDVALDIHDRFPDKRLIIHYMQPHYPFIGPTGEKIGEQASFKSLYGWLNGASVWDQLAAGEIKQGLLKNAYQENLRIVLPEVDRLTRNLEGKTVVTSDHGNLYGKKVSLLPVRIYGHQPGIRDPELTAVPWIELSSKKRLLK